MSRSRLDGSPNLNISTLSHRIFQETRLFFATIFMQLVARAERPAERRWRFMHISRDRAGSDC
jgi:hypothetical protein